MPSVCSSGSIYWVLQVWGRFRVSETIIPEAQEHFLTPSARRHTHLVRWIGVDRTIAATVQVRLGPID